MVEQLVVGLALSTMELAVVLGAIAHQERSLNATTVVIYTHRLISTDALRAVLLQLRLIHSVKIHALATANDFTLEALSSIRIVGRPATYSVRALLATGVRIHLVIRNTGQTFTLIKDVSDEAVGLDTKRVFNDHAIHALCAVILSITGLAKGIDHIASQFGTCITR